MQSIRQAIVALGLIVLTAGSAGAQQTVWVTDEWRINLRSGAGNQYRIIEVLSTGASMALLERGEQWAQVRVDGTEGWVRTQYLADRAPAAERLEGMQADLNAARERVASLEEELQAAGGELEAARGEAESLGGERESLRQRLDEARAGLELSDENKELKKQAIDLQRRIQDLRNETERLSDRSRQDWFVVGAGVLFAGMLFGVIMTRIRWRRRSTWSQL